MRTCSSIGTSLTLVTVLALAGAVDAQTVSPAVKQDVSPPLSSVPAPLPKAQ